MGGKGEKSSGKGKELSVVVGSDGSGDRHAVAAAMDVDDGEGGPPKQYCPEGAPRRARHVVEIAARTGSGAACAARAHVVGGNTLMQIRGDGIGIGGTLRHGRALARARAASPAP